MYPILLISKAWISLEGDLRERGFRTFRLDTVQIARDIFRSLRGAQIEPPVVFGDLSHLEHRMDMVRGLLEEPGLKVVLLASRDNLTSGVMSRVSRVEVDPTVIEFPSDGGWSLLKESLLGGEDLTPDLVRRQVPSMGGLMHSLIRSGLPSKKKLLDLLIRDKLK